MLAYDLIGRPHTLRTDEAAMHSRSLSCRCSPHVIINACRVRVITHRRLRNSRSMYQPWERGN